MRNLSLFKTHRNLLHALKMVEKNIKTGKFSTLLELLILFLFQLKPCEMISIGTKGTGNSRMLFPLW